jgi:DNA repair protein RecO (recombination protein O)
MAILHPTRGIVLRAVKYGETSLVVSIFTELFGLQNYMVNGVRTSKKSTGISVAQLQPGNLLELVVYQNEKQALQRIKECKNGIHYRSVYLDVTKNAVLLYMIELLQKCLKQPDAHPELFYFLEDMLKGLDCAGVKQTANIPLFYTIHLSHFFGFRLMDNFSSTRQYLDLHEGQFVGTAPMHQMVIHPPLSDKIAQLLRVMLVEELGEIELNKHQRNLLLDDLLNFYVLHIHPFGSLRSLPVIRTVLENESE